MFDVSYERNKCLAISLTTGDLFNVSNDTIDDIRYERRQQERSPFRFRAAILDSFFLQGRCSFLSFFFAFFPLRTSFRNAEPNEVSESVRRKWQKRGPLASVASRALYYSTSPA